MVNFCAVYGCSNRSNREKDRSLTADTLPNTNWSNLRSNTGKLCILLVIFISFSRFLRSIALIVNPGLDRL